MKPPQGTVKGAFSELTMQIAHIQPKDLAEELSNPYSQANKEMLAEQLIYLKYLFTDLSKQAMASTSKQTRSELLRDAMQAQSNYCKTLRLLMELKKEGEKRAVYTLESDPYS